MISVSDKLCLIQQSQYKILLPSSSIFVPFSSPLFSSALQHKTVYQMGMKYTVSEFLVVGQQDDDFSIFGQIKHIVVVSGNCFLAGLYVKRGIEQKYHGFVVQRTSGIGTYYPSGLAEYQPLQAHQPSNGNLCITFYSLIENISILDAFVSGCSQLNSLANLYSAYW